MTENDDFTPGASSASTPTPRRSGPDTRYLQAKIALGLGGALILAFLFLPHSTPERRFEDGYLMDESGAPVALASQLAPATLVHFWATWCPPCRREIPSLLAFAGEVGSERLGLVLVAVADERERAVKFVSNRQFPVLFDPVWDVAHRFRTRQLPETHLVVDGKIVASFAGASDWRSPAVRRAVLARLAAPASSPAR